MPKTHDGIQAILSDLYLGLAQWQSSEITNVGFVVSEIISVSHHKVYFPGNMFREAPRRREDRQANYDDRFDSRTLFSDSFMVPEGIELLGPPLLNTRDTILSSKFLVDGKRFSGQVESRDRHRISRTILHGVESAQEVVVATPEGNVQLEVNSLVSQFDGHRVLVTQQRNNPLEWIRYWLEFHAVHHGIDAVLIYDNGSTVYSCEAVEQMVREVDMIAIGAVVDWDVPFGVTGGPNQVWDSDYGQHQVLEHAMRYVLSGAKSVIQQDVDELAIAEDGRSVCELIENSEWAEVRYSRRQILPVPTRSAASGGGGGPRLHCDYAYYRGGDSTYLAGKYACVPGRVPRSSHYLAHGVESADRIFVDGIIARHYGGIRIDWRAGESEPVANETLGSVDGEVVLDERALASYEAVPVR